MLTSFQINVDGSCAAVIRTTVGGENRDTLHVLPREVVDGFLDSCGDGVSSYREDLTALVLAQG